MVRELQSEIQDNVSRYLKSEISLQNFEDWFVPAMWDLAEGEDNESRRLAGSVSNMIAEYSHGYRSEQSLREGLATAIRLL